MKRYCIKIFIVCAILLGTSELANAACTQTLSPGAALASAISSAAAGSTICLNSGNYGTVMLGSFTKSPPVIVQSVTAQGASMGLTAQNGANGVTFDSINFSSGGATISNSSTKNITIKNSAFGTSQLVIVTTNFNNNNILIDHNTFGAYNSTGYEGRLTITWGAGAPGPTPSGVTVTNNTFGPGGCSDGIQIGAKSVMIGPGNVFTGMVQGSCSAHVDAIQGYGQGSTSINGNYFTGNTINIGFYDGGSSETITNNVFGPPTTVAQNIQLGGVVGMTLAHNTFRNTIVAYGSKAGNSPNSGWIIQNNVLVNSDLIASGDQPGCGANCIVRYNLVDAQSSIAPTGTNIVSGTPTFVGGNPPTTWAGYQLAGSSLGSKAGNDGQDMGANYFVGSTSGTQAPVAPTNLKVQ